MKYKKSTLEETRKFGFFKNLFGRKGNKPGIGTTISPTSTEQQPDPTVPPSSNTQPTANAIPTPPPNPTVLPPSLNTPNAGSQPTANAIPTPPPHPSTPMVTSLADLTAQVDNKRKADAELRKQQQEAQRNQQKQKAEAARQQAEAVKLENKNKRENAAMEAARKKMSDSNSKVSGWDRFKNNINRSINGLSQYYKKNGHSLVGGMAKQLGKKGLALGAGLGTTALAVGTGGVGALGALALGAGAGTIGKNLANNSSTSLRNAIAEKQMRDAKAKQLMAMRKARAEGRLTNEEYNNLRDNELAQMKIQKANIHDIAQNGRSGFWKTLLPWNRNNKARNYIKSVNTDTSKINSFRK